MLIYNTLYWRSWRVFAARPILLPLFYYKDPNPDYVNYLYTSIHIWYGLVYELAWIFQYILLINECIFIVDFLPLEGWDGWGGVWSSTGRNRQLPVYSISLILCLPISLVFVYGHLMVIASFVYILGFCCFLLLCLFVALFVCFFSCFVCLFACLCVWFCSRYRSPFGHIQMCALHVVMKKYQTYLCNFTKYGPNVNDTSYDTKPIREVLEPNNCILGWAINKEKQATSIVKKWQVCKCRKVNKCMHVYLASEKITVRNSSVSMTKPCEEVICSCLDPRDVGVSL